MIAALIVASVLMTSFVSGIFGMAGGLMLMGILGVLLSVEHAMIVHGISQLTANGSRSINLLKHICWKPVLHYFIGAATAFLKK